jgi:hypothetical protein
MPKFEKSAAEEIERASMNRPHVVLLGAGASRAAFPKGERNGRLLPLMLDFTDIVPIADTLKKAGVSPADTNFENTYSNLCLDLSKAHAREAVEEEVFRYFSSLELPETPTLYDHLVLGLRSKDAIATFNWDPFLIQAAQRNAHLTAMPKLLFLHGNVLQGFCPKDRVHGVRDASCSRCGGLFKPVKLLYPIRDKDYTKDPAISAAWDAVLRAFESAFMVTVFGYSAPTTDGGAIRLLRDAWGGSSRRSLEQFEFIDVREENSLITSWRGFVDPGDHHYDIHREFSSSWIANHPRRTGEAYWDQYMEALFIDNNPVPQFSSLDELWTWYEPLLKAEDSFR